MSVGVMKDYKLKLWNLRASHTPVPRHNRTGAHKRPFIIVSLPDFVSRKISPSLLPVESNRERKIVFLLKRVLLLSRFSLSRISERTETFLKNLTQSPRLLGNQVVVITKTFYFFFIFFSRKN